MTDSNPEFAVVAGSSSDRPGENSSEAPSLETTASPGQGSQLVLGQSCTRVCYETDCTGCPYDRAPVPYAHRDLAVPVLSSPGRDCRAVDSAVVEANCSETDQVPLETADFTDGLGGEEPESVTDLPAAEDDPGWPAPGELPFPDRPVLRACDVVVDPPARRLEEVARRWWAAALRIGRPALSAVVRQFRRNYLIATALVILAVLIGHDIINRAPQRAEARRLAVIHEHVAGLLEEVQREIGGGLQINQLRIEELEFAAGTYSSRGRVITVNPRVVGWGDDYLLYLLAHECVHGIFDQMGLSRYWRSIEHQLVEEVAATVLGAHIAGRVWTRMGNDGDALTRAFVARHRWISETGIAHRDLAFRVLSPEFQVHDYEIWLVLNRYGDARIVDETERLCREHRDPYEASRAIARHFRLTDPFGPELPK